VDRSFEENLLRGDGSLSRRFGVPVLGGMRLALVESMRADATCRC
jgi:hypothetical protein